jgi:hypothetical protein
VGNAGDHLAIGGHAFGFGQLSYSFLNSLLQGTIQLRQLFGARGNERFQFSLPRLQLPHAQQIDARPQSYQKHSDEHGEDSRLVEVRRERDSTRAPASFHTPSLLHAMTRKRYRPGGMLV